MEWTAVPHVQNTSIKIPFRLRNDSKQAGEGA